MSKKNEVKKIEKIKGIELVLFDLDDTLFDTTGTLDATYKNLPNIVPFPGIHKLIQTIPCPKVVVTKGNAEIQNKKIDILGLRDELAGVVITKSDEEKMAAFASAISTFKVKDPSKVLVIGNRIDSEIRYGNMLGCLTVFLKHGKFADLVPKDAFEIPHITVKTITDISAYF